MTSLTYSVRQARALAEKTQAEMAERLGVTRETYRRIEQNPGRATVDQAIAIARITGIPIDQIFFADDSTICRVTE